MLIDLCLFLTNKNPQVVVDSTSQREFIGYKMALIVSNNKQKAKPSAYLMASVSIVLV
jgi:hypothetical protein